MWSGPMKEAKHWWSGWTLAQRDVGALCKRRSGEGSRAAEERRRGSRAGRQAHGGEVGVEALAVCRVGGGAGKAASPKGPCKVAGGSGRAGAAAAGVVAKSTAKGELAGQARAAIGESNMAIGAGPADSIEPVEICPPLLLMARVVGGVLRCCYWQGL